MGEYIPESFILHFCTHFNFPSNVKSTALQLLKHINGKVSIDIYNMIYLVLLLSIKLEDIQESIFPKLKQFYNRKLKEELIYQKEIEIIKLIDYNFSFNNAYMAMFGICISLNEMEKINFQDDDFNKLEKILDFCLVACYPDLKTATIFPIIKYYNICGENLKYLFNTYKLDEHNIKIMSINIKNVKLLNKKDLFYMLDTNDSNN